MKYDVIMEDEMDNLIVAVNVKLSQGWRLVGGVARSESPSVWCQAIVQCEGLDDVIDLVKAVEKEPMADLIALIRECEK